MTLAEAIRAVDDMFTVHEEIGFPVSYTSQDGKHYADAPRDLTRAPCGQEYVTVSSFGIEPADGGAMFRSEGLAVKWWMSEIEDYAASIWVERTLWNGLHLYWKTKPAWYSTTYLAMDQRGLLQTASPLASLLQLELGFVQAQLLISELGPDGKKG